LRHQLQRFADRLWARAVPAPRSKARPKARPAAKTLAAALMAPATR
jgi:hypothetical protein